MCHGVLQYDAAADAWRAGHTCGMTHSYVRQDSFMRVTERIHICDINSFACVTWLIHAFKDVVYFTLFIHNCAIIHWYVFLTWLMTIFSFLILFHSLANLPLYAHIPHACIYTLRSAFIHKWSWLTRMFYMTHDKKKILYIFPLIGQFSALCVHSPFNRAYTCYMTHSFTNVSGLTYMSYYRVAKTHRIP